MPITNITTDNGYGVVTTLEGTISGTELINAQKQRYSSNKKILLLKYILADFSLAENIDLHTNDILDCSNLSMAASKINPNICIAAVMNSDLGYGVSRMWQAYIDDIPWEAQVFRCRGDAEQWLLEKIDNKFTFSK